MQRIRLRDIPLISLLLAGAVGCHRNSGPARYDLSGSVTYAGKPVPAGQILFVPDASKGNDGPGTAADIRNGRYQTEPGQGTIGGAHVVSIFGLDGKPIPYGGVMNPTGSPLFPEYKTQVDLPRQASTQDFTVPTGAAGPK